MVYQELLLEEHSKKQATWIAQLLIGNPNHLPAYLKLLTLEKKVAQRASWPLSIIADQAPSLLSSYHSTLLHAAEHPLHPAVQRNVLRYFQFTSVKDEEILGRLLDLAFRQMETPATAIAIRVFSMQVIYTHTSDFPELKQALADAIALNIQDESAGFKSRGNRILKQLEKEGIYPNSL